MQIASILIGGIERKPKTLLQGFEITRDYADRFGIANMILLIDPTQTALIGRATLDGAYMGDNAVEEGMSVEIFRTADSESGEFGDPSFGDPLFGEADAVGDAIFRGEVVRVHPRPAWYLRQINPGAFGELFGDVSFGEEFEDAPDTITIRARYLLEIECRDITARLDQKDVDDERTYSETTDDAIIVDACGEFYPELDTTNVDTTAYIKSFKFEEGESLLSGLNRLAERTGASFYVDVDERLFWYLPTANPAPWGISDEPDGVTTFACERQSLDINREWQTPCNKVRVVGAVNGTVNISVVENDYHSQAVYGIRSRTVVDRSCDTVEEARARCRVFLGENAWPKVSGQFSIRREGLEIGQVVPVTWGATLNQAGEFLIRRVTMKWHSKTTVEYQVEFGDWRPDLFRAIKRMAELSEESSTVPVAVPPAGSVTIDSLAGSLGLIQNVNGEPALPDPAYPANAVILDISLTPPKLKRRSGNTWVATVPTTDLTGTVTTTQIDDNSISTPKLQALSVTASVLAANAVTAGKVAADAITAGTIAAGAISAADAVFQAAAIVTADIADLSVTNIKIASGLSASKMTTGTLDADLVTVTNLDASSINAGELIVRPSAGYMGKIAVQDSGGTTIGWIGGDGGYVGGWFQNLYIGGSGASTAKVVANTSGNISVSLSSATDAFTISNSSSSTYLVATSAVLTIGSAASTPADFSTINKGIILLSTSGSGSLDLNTAGGFPKIIMNTSQVLRERQTGWGSPTGTSTKSAFDTATVTTSQLAERVKALIEACKDYHGFISA